MAKYADFSGHWRAIEYEDDNFIKFFEAMGLPNPKMALQMFKQGRLTEYIDTGDSITLRLPDPKNEGGTYDLVFHVGKEDVVMGPLGLPVKKFTTRGGNWIQFDETGPHGEKNVTKRWIEGDTMTVTKTDPVTGITAKMTKIREPASNPSL